MNVRRFGLFLGVAAGLTACGGKDGRDGPTGRDASCGVEVVDGVATIICDDGTTTPLDPGSCHVSSNGDGTHTLTCPGGQTTIIRDGEKLAGGAIVGTASRFAMRAGPGITVEVVGREEQVATDEAGRFSIELPAGIHEVRLSYPGYVPVHVPNVLVLGNRTDIGEHVLQFLRPIGATSRLLDLIQAEDESWIAVLLKDGLGAADQHLVDVETGKHTLIAREVFGQAQIGSRLLLALLEPDKPWAVNVYDVEKKKSFVLDGLTEFFWFSNGVFYEQGGDRLRFLPADQSKVVDLGETIFTNTDSNDRWVVLWHPDNGLKLFDTESLALHVLDEARTSTEGAFVDQESGRAAWFDGTTGAFKTFDPQSLEVKDFGPSRPGEVWWAPGGRYVVFPDPVSGHLFADLDDGSIRPVPVDTSSVAQIRFDPAGRWLITTAWFEKRVVVWGQEPILTIPGTYYDVGVTESGRFAVFRATGVVLVIDTEGGASSTAVPVAGWPNVGILPGEKIVIEEDSGFFLYDLLTANRHDPYEAEGYSVFSPDNRRVGFREPGDGKVSVAVLEEGLQLTSTVTGMPAGWSLDGRYLAAIVDETRRLLLMSPDLSVEIPVADSVAGAIPMGSGMFVITMLPDDDYLYNWVVFP